MKGAAFSVRACDSVDRVILPAVQLLTRLGVPRQKIAATRQFHGKGKRELASNPTIASARIGFTWSNDCGKNVRFFQILSIILIRLKY